VRLLAARRRFTTRNKAMTSDFRLLADHELAGLGVRQPSTPWGAELMRTAWPQRYPGLLSSETYRGCASVLSALLAAMHPGIGVGAIQQLVERVDQAVKGSPIAQTQNDACGGAVLTVTNAWTTAADLGFTAPQIAAAYESELIYAAKMFVRARQQEAAGKKLP
jgi:hypothetical protein